MIIYKKISDICAAHQLKGHQKCGLLHGHNYTFEVEIEADKLTDDFGFVVDFGEISKLIKEKYDHTGKIITISAEKMAKETYDMIKAIMPVKPKRIKVRVWETSTSFAEYEA